MPKIQLAGLLTGWLHHIPDSFTKQKKQVYLGATCVRNVEKEEIYCVESPYLAVFQGPFTFMPLALNQALLYHYMRTKRH